MTTTPPVTALICTRNRGDSIAATIRSVLTCPYPDLTLLIVDQSSDLRTAQAIAACGADPRLHYVHTTSQGLSVALNIGLSFVKTELVLITDDDCEVPPNWASEIVATFSRYPQVGAVFCNVIPAQHDPQAGFVPDCISPRSFLVEDFAHWQTSDGLNIGIGAGMAIRRSVAEALGGFDPLLGSGSYFRSGNDTDFAIRTLLAGYQVYRTTEVDILHHGFRTYEQGRKLIRNNLYALGGIYGQMLRHGHMVALRRYASIWMIMVIQPTLDAIRQRRVPRVIGRVNWLLRGIIKGLLLGRRHPTDSLRLIPDR